MTSPSQHVSIVIDRPDAIVYQYAADPANLPRWAAGLARSTVEQIDGQWVADSPMGQVTVGFTEHNTLGVLDHALLHARGR